MQHSGKTGDEVREFANAARRNQIDRIIHSEALRDRDSLKRLLGYLADRTLEDTADGLKEYTVGIEVFHKPESYDPQRDGSVRQHLGKLRQKLEEYYRSEGDSDPIRVELPKRQFRLVFHESATAGKRRRIFNGIWIPIGCILLLPLAYWLGSLHRAAPASNLDPAVRLLWAPFLDSDKPTVVCLGTPLFLRNRSFRVRDSHLNAFDAPGAQTVIADLQKRLGLDSFVPTFDYTGIGEAYAAFEVAKVFVAAHREIALTRNNVLSWNEIRNENVVFLGAPKFNPHLAALSADLEFTLNGSQVVNAHPRAGESATYGRINDADLNAAEDYVLIDRLQGIDPAGRILILEGGSTSSAFAAADFICRSATASMLVSRMKLSDGALPLFFQVLLHVKYRAAVPIQTDFVAFRAIRAK